jgi:hypothetical protein
MRVLSLSSEAEPKCFRVDVDEPQRDAQSNTLGVRVRSLAIRPMRNKRGNDEGPPTHLKKLLNQTDNAGLQDHFGVNRKKIWRTANTSYRTA